MSRALPERPMPAADGPRSLRARYAEGRTRIATRWQRLAPREQRLVTLAATLGGLVLAWQFLFLPAWRTTQTLSDTLPALRAQAAQLDAIISQARALDAGRAAAGAALTEQDLAQSLARNGLAAQAVVTRTAEHWEVALTAAPIEPVLAWLRDAGAELRAQPVMVDLARVADEDGAILPGVVSGVVHLAGAAEGARP